MYQLLFVRNKKDRRSGKEREERKIEKEGDEGVTESYCKRRERMKFTELHIAVVTFHPLKFIFSFLVPSYAFFVRCTRGRKKR